MITGRKLVRYPDGTEALAWVGTGLFDDQPWSSREPRVLHEKDADFLRRILHCSAMVSAPMKTPTSPVVSSLRGEDPGPSSTVPATDVADSAQTLTHRFAISENGRIGMVSGRKSRRNDDGVEELIWVGRRLSDLERWSNRAPRALSATDEALLQDHILRGRDPALSETRPPEEGRTAHHILRAPGCDKALRREHRQTRARPGVTTAPNVMVRVSLQAAQVDEILDVLHLLSTACKLGRRLQKVGLSFDKLHTFFSLPSVHPLMRAYDSPGRLGVLIADTLLDESAVAETVRLQSAELHITDDHSCLAFWSDNHQCLYWTLQLYHYHLSLPPQTPACAHVPYYAFWPGSRSPRPGPRVVPTSPGSVA